MLVKRLVDKSNAVAQEALDILDEACDDPVSVLINFPSNFDLLKIEQHHSSRSFFKLISYDGFDVTYSCLCDFSLACIVLQSRPTFRPYRYTIIHISKNFLRNICSTIVNVKNALFYG